MDNITQKEFDKRIFCAFCGIDNYYKNETCFECKLELKELKRKDV